MARTLEQTLEEACAAGVRAIQIREKSIGSERVLDLTQKLKSILPKETLLFVNDRPDIAIMTGISGVHLSSKSPSAEIVREKYPQKKLIIGRSTHSLEEVRGAEQQGVDFVVYGPVYDTPSKRLYGPPIGVKALGEAARKSKVPIFALGGVTSARVKECLDAGAHGVAVISAIMAASSVKETVNDFNKTLGQL